MKDTKMKSKVSLALFFGIILLTSACRKGDPPVVLEFTPEFGSAETLITLKGENFDDLVELNFNDDVPADFNPSFGTENALLFRVPLNAPLGENNVKVKTLHGETTFPFRVTLLPPEVADFYPKSANTGDLVYILGENFFEPLEILFFDSIPGQVLFASEDSIAVQVPEGVEKGRIKVKANGGSSFTSEVFFTTQEILVNDFDGNGVRSNTDLWRFYGNIDQNASTAIHNSNPEPINDNFLKISGVDPGSIWIGGTENHSNDINVFENFGIESDINNTFLELDVNNNGAKDTHLILVLGERNGSFNDFTETLHLDEDGWVNYRLPLNRFTDIDGANIDPSKIRVVKLHLYNELGVTNKLEANVDNLKFIQIN